jgi:hypothetical protein
MIMSQDNPTLSEMGITGRSAAALEKVGLTARQDLEAYGLDSVELISGIGDDYAADIREKVAASYPSPAAEVAEAPEEDPEVAEAPIEAPEATPEAAEAESAPGPAEPAVAEPEPVEPADVAEPTADPEAVVVPVLDIDDEIENARLERMAAYALSGILAGAFANPNPSQRLDNEATRANTALLHAKAAIAAIDAR